MSDILRPVCSGASSSYLDPEVRAFVIQLPHASLSFGQKHQYKITPIKNGMKFRQHPLLVDSLPKVKTKSNCVAYCYEYDDGTT